MKLQELFVILLIVLTAGVGCNSDNVSSKDAADPAHSFTEGVYIFEKKDGSGNELQIDHVENGGLHFQLIAVGVAPAYNQGFMEGAAKISGGVALIETNEFGGTCALSLTPVDSVSVRVETLQGDPASCGFGNGVVPDGVYKLESTATTSMAGIDPAQLNGIWRSTIDPTYELAIGEGKFTEYNRGEKVDELACEFHQNCPEPCSKEELNNCLVAWNVQDTFCYKVIAVDLKKLELSLIGGTGRSLLFERLK